MEVIFIGWLAGVLIQLYQAQLWSNTAYLILSALSLLTLLGAGRCWRMRQQQCVELPQRSRVGGFVHSLIIFLLIASLGFSWAGHLAVKRSGQILNPELEQQDILVRGVVDELPQLQSGRWRFILNIKEGYLKGGEEVLLPSRLMLSWYLNSTTEVPEIKVGQEWVFEVRLKAPHGSLNPHTFDYELWLWGQNIGAVGYVRMAKDSPLPTLLNYERTYSFMEQWREDTRHKIMERVSNSREAGLLAALTLGDQRAITQADWDIFRITGVAHLVSISGLHITMMAWIAYGFFGWLWRRSTRLMLLVPAHTAAMFIGLLCAACYAWFAGWGVPAQRTILMLATVVILRSSGIRWPWYVVWLFVAAVVTAISPWALLQAGFWLSFVAVGVLFAQATDSVNKRSGDEREEPKKQEDEIERVKRQLAQATPKPWWLRLLMHLGRSTKELLIIQFRISIALAPLTLLLFQQVSVVGLLANMLAIPWVTFVIVPLALLGILFNPLWQIAAWAGSVLLTVLEWFSSWPLSVLEGALPPLLIAIVGVVGAIVLVLPRFKWRYRLLGLVALLPVFVWQPSSPKVGEFEAWFLDVGQGSSVLVRTANHALLFDTGAKYSSDSDVGAVLITPTLRAMGVSLDRIVVSHADQDHSGGLESIWQAHPKADLLLSAPQDHSLWQIEPQPNKAAQKQGCVAGHQWEWDGIIFEVLHPFTNVAEQNDGIKSSTNAHSCVLKISTKDSQGGNEASILLTGDIEEAQEVQLLQASGQQDVHLRADVLLMPHHGSHSSSSDGFIKAVSPTWAVAQAGYLNRYNHPAPSVIKRYQNQDVKLINTVSCGAALWRSQKPEVIECERVQRARYWQHQNMRDGLK